MLSGHLKTIWLMLMGHFINNFHYCDPHSHHSSAETSLFHNPNLHYLIHHYYVTSNSSYKCFHCFHHLIQTKIIISFKAAVELDRFTIDACPSSMIWDALKVIPTMYVHTINCIILPKMLVYYHSYVSLCTC